MIIEKILHSMYWTLFKHRSVLNASNDSYKKYPISSSVSWILLGIGSPILSFFVLFSWNFGKHNYCLDLCYLHLRIQLQSVLIVISSSPQPSFHGGEMYNKSASLSLSPSSLRYTHGWKWRHECWYNPHTAKTLKPAKIDKTWTI